MKIFIRIIRVILGLALLTAFVFGLYTFAQAAPKSGDYLAQLDEQAAPVTPASAPVVTTPKPVSAAPQQGESAAPAEGGTESPVVEPAPEPTPLPNTPAARAAALGLPEPPNVDITSWEFMLVNGDHSIDQYEPEKFGYVNPTIDAFDVQTYFNPDRTEVDFRIAQALLDFGTAAEEDPSLRTSTASAPTTAFRTARTRTAITSRCPPAAASTRAVCAATSPIAGTAPRRPTRCATTR